MCFSHFKNKIKAKFVTFFNIAFTSTALTFVPSPRVVVSVFEVEPYETRNGFAYLTSMVAHSVMSLVKEGNTQHAPLLACRRHSSIFSVCWTKVKHGHGPPTCAGCLLERCLALVPFLAGWSAANSFCPVSCEQSTTWHDALARFGLFHRVRKTQREYLAGQFIVPSLGGVQRG